MQFTKEMKKAAMQAKSPEDLIEIATKYDINISEEESKVYFAKLNIDGEVDMETLEDVAGGGCQTNTYMECYYSDVNGKKCGFANWWEGDYVGQTLECPWCHNKTLIGQHT